MGVAAFRSMLMTTLGCTSVALLEWMIAMILQCMVVMRFVFMGVVVFGCMVVGEHGSCVYIGMGNSACSSEGKWLLYIVNHIRPHVGCLCTNETLMVTWIQKQNE